MSPTPSEPQPPREQGNVSRFTERQKLKLTEELPGYLRCITDSERRKFHEATFQGLWELEHEEIDYGDVSASTQDQMDELRQVHHDFLP